MGALEKFFEKEKKGVIAAPKIIDQETIKKNNEKIIWDTAFAFLTSFEFIAYGAEDTLNLIFLRQNAKGGSKNIVDILENDAKDFYKYLDTYKNKDGEYTYKNTFNVQSVSKYYHSIYEYIKDNKSDKEIQTVFDNLYSFITYTEEFDIIIKRLSKFIDASKYLKKKSNLKAIYDFKIEEWRKKMVTMFGDEKELTGIYLDKKQIKELNELRNVYDKEKYDTDKKETDKKITDLVQSTKTNTDDIVVMKKTIADLEIKIKSLTTTGSGGTIK